MERLNFPLTLCTASQSSLPKCNRTVDFPSMEESPNFFVLSNPRARPRKKLVINEISREENRREVWDGRRESLAPNRPRAAEKETGTEGFFYRRPRPLHGKAQKKFGTHFTSWERG